MMRPWIVMAMAAAGAACVARGPATPRQAGTAPDARCQVWARELSFADAVARHDPAAFAEHVHPAAVFRPSIERPTRGRDAVVQAWAGVIRGDTVTVAWYPARVVVATENLAYSSGPALWTVQGKDRPVRELGTFHSVWTRDADGAWRVLFDDGSEGKPATPADIAAFDGARRTACPPA